MESRFFLDARKDLIQWGNFEEVPEDKLAEAILIKGCKISICLFVERRILLDLRPHVVWFFGAGVEGIPANTASNEHCTATIGVNRLVVGVEG